MQVGAVSTADSDLLIGHTLGTASDEDFLVTGLDDLEELGPDKALAVGQPIDIFVNSKREIGAFRIVRSCPFFDWRQRVRDLFQ